MGIRKISCSLFALVNCCMVQHKFTWVFPKIGVPQNWIKLMVYNGNPIKMDDLGFSPYFWKHPHGVPAMTCELMALAQGNSGAAWAPRLCVWPIRHGPKWCEFGGWTASRIRTHQKCPKLEIDTTWYKTIQNPSKTPWKQDETHC